MITGIGIIKIINVNNIKNFKDSLTEMPIIMKGSLNKKYLDANLVKPISNALKENKIQKIGDFNEYEVGEVALNKAESIFLFFKDNKIVIATNVFLNDCGLLQVKITKKFFNEYKNILIDLYSFISIKRGDYIFCNSIQTITSANIWQKMIKDSENKIIVYYNCEEAIEINIKEKIEKIWSDRNYIVGFKG